MGPPHYHRHDGLVATPELGHRMYGYTLWGWIVLWSYQSVTLRTVSNALRDSATPSPRECTNWISSTKNIYIYNKTK